jgi:hypothetical protein
VLALAAVLGLSPLLRLLDPTRPFVTVPVTVTAQIFPQAVCTGPNRLAIAAFFAVPVRVLMVGYIIVSYPISKLMDVWLGTHALPQSVWSVWCVYVCVCVRGRGRVRVCEWRVRPAAPCQSRACRVASHRTWLLRAGDDRFTTYRRSELKALIALHGVENEKPQIHRDDSLYDGVGDTPRGDTPRDGGDGAAAGDAASGAGAGAGAGAGTGAGGSAGGSVNGRHVTAPDPLSVVVDGGRATPGAAMSSRASTASVDTEQHEATLLSADEVAIMHGALDLRQKTVEEHMVRLGNVFMLEYGYVPLLLVPSAHRAASPVRLSCDEAVCVHVHVRVVVVVGAVAVGLVAVVTVVAVVDVAAVALLSLLTVSSVWRL